MRRALWTGLVLMAVTGCAGNGDEAADLRSDLSRAEYETHQAKADAAKLRIEALRFAIAVVRAKPQEERESYEAGFVRGLFDGCSTFIRDWDRCTEDIFSDVFTGSSRELRDAVDHRLSKASGPFEAWTASFWALDLDFVEFVNALCEAQYRQANSDLDSECKDALAMIEKARAEQQGG